MVRRLIAWKTIAVKDATYTVATKNKMGVVELILGDPGADSGGKGKSKRAENMARRKVKNGEKSPWGQYLTRAVPNGRRRSGF